MRVRHLLPVIAISAALAMAGCAQTPPPVSEKVQRAYDEGLKANPLPTTVDPLAAGRADGSLTTYFIGDSLTDGWNATEQPNSFRPLVTASLLKGGQVDVSADFKAGAKLSEVAEMAAVPEFADLIVLELGTNDVDQTEIENFRTDLDALVTRLATSKPVLVCVGTWQTGTTRGFDGQIQQACEAAGGRFVRIGDIRASPAMVAQVGTAAYPADADGAHPNNAGHAEIARRILASLGI